MLAGSIELLSISKEDSLDDGPPIPPAPADTTWIRTAQLNSFGIPDPQNHEQKKGFVKPLKQ